PPRNCSSNRAARPTRPPARGPRNWSGEPARATAGRRPGRAASGQRGVQGDVTDAGQGLGHRAAHLGGLGGGPETDLVHVLDATSHGQLDAADAEPARRVGAEGDIGGDVQALGGAAVGGDLRRQRHGVAGRVRGREQLLRAGGAVGVVGGPLRERHVVLADPGTGQLDLTGTVLRTTGPGGARGTCWHHLPFVKKLVLGSFSCTLERPRAQPRAGRFAHQPTAAVPVPPTAVPNSRRPWPPQPTAAVPVPTTAVPNSRRPWPPQPTAAEMRSSSCSSI